LNRLHLAKLVPVCPSDLARPAELREAVRFVEAEIKARGLSGLYALVNNAGGGSIAPIELIDTAKFQHDLEVRIVGSLFLVQRLLPLIRQAAGRVLWIMIPALIPTPFVASIHACDFAVNCLARTLEIELKPWEIRQIMVRCGGIKTPRVARSAAELMDSFQTWPRESFLLYKDALLRWKEDMGKFDSKRTDPIEVAKVVSKALCAAKPKPRYSVGYMAGAAAFLFHPEKAVLIEFLQD
jgi:NAD(P)-dependent dehydrogenase (short-subunit alcohol dehydrogenase family)